MPTIDVVLRCIKGEIYKTLFKAGLLRPSKKPLNIEQTKEKKVIVSLTSYGRRVKDVAPYAIMSLMRQSYRPDKIVLWLDDINWNHNNLPKRLYKLIDLGLEVRFTRDIKSYKKLIPALETFPDDLIFTVDDDIYYPRNLLKKVMHAYEKDNDCIHAVRGYDVSFIASHILKEYNSWQPIKEEITSKYAFPTGGAGCLYQKRLLSQDVLKQELFMTLAPQADDVWFFFMEYLAGSKIHILECSKHGTISMDSFYQHFHHGSSLMETNCGENQNDIQIKNIINHYELPDIKVSYDSINKPIH